MQANRVTKNLDLNEVRAFVALWRLGSYARAAEELCYTEAAVYWQVKRLERTTGCRLVQRNKKSLVLTRAGEALIGPAAELVTVSETFANAARTMQGNIVVAAGEFSGPGLALPRAAEFMHENPETDIEVYIADRRDIVNGVISGSVDIGIGGVLSRMDDFRKGRVKYALETVQIGWEEWCLITSNSLDIDALARAGKPLTLYVHRGSMETWRASWEAFLTSLDFPLTNVVELQTGSLVRAAVENGLGLGITALTPLIGEPHTGRYRRLGPLPGASRFAVEAMYSRTHLTPIVASLIEHLARRGAPMLKMAQSG